jgi:hypothetical protein
VADKVAIREPRGSRPGKGLAWVAPGQGAGLGRARARGWPGSRQGKGLAWVAPGQEARQGKRCTRSRGAPVAGRYWIGSCSWSVAHAYAIPLFPSTFYVPLFSWGLGDMTCVEILFKAKGSSCCMSYGWPPPPILGALKADRLGGGRPPCGLTSWEGEGRPQAG